MKRMLIACAAAIICASAQAHEANGIGTWTADMDKGPKLIQSTYRLVLDVHGDTAILDSGMSYADCRIAEASYVLEGDLLTTPSLLDIVNVLPIGSTVKCVFEAVSMPVLPTTAPLPTPRPDFSF